MYYSTSFSGGGGNYAFIFIFRFEAISKNVFSRKNAIDLFYEIKHELFHNIDIITFNAPLINVCK